MNAWRAGVMAFNGKALVPSQDNATWANFDSRMFRYAHADAYYTNVVYTNLVSYSAAHKFQGGLYRHTRGIYNPTHRLVETYVSKVYGGQLDLKDMSAGAIPITADNPLIKDAIRQLWKWSNWGTQKSLFARYGATYGDAPIWITDDRESQKVRMEVIHPSRIKDADFDDVGNVKRVVIEYIEYDEQLTSPTGNMRRPDTYTKTLVCDQNKFYTYKDGEPFAFYKDADGTLLKEWDNEYGFVPLVIGKHNDVGLQWGANAIAGSTRKIDEVNDATSLLNDQVRKAVNVSWYYAGVDAPDQNGEVDITVVEKDGVGSLYGPAGSKPEAMIAPLAIESALANIKSMLDELERDMPELLLHNLITSSDLTLPGISAAYSSAIDRINEARGMYDDALVRAQMMAISIGGKNRYKEFESFTLDSYASGDLEHYIAERPVINIGISKEKKIDVLISTEAPASAIWAEVGVSEDMIKKWEFEKVVKQQMMIEAQRTNPPPQLPDGTSPPNGQDGQPTNPAQPSNPVVRGSKLPSDKAKHVKPITPDELTQIANRSRQGGNNA